MSYKSLTNSKLWEVYRAVGLEKFLIITQKMLELRTNKNNTEFHAHVHGEICETVLAVIIQEYIDKNNLSDKGWFFINGLILRDVDRPGSGYFTELDVTVFTPQKIFAFECKSYGGPKQISKECTIRKAKGQLFDVFSQHEKHTIQLSKTLEPFRINIGMSIAPYQLSLFNYSLGECVDSRDEKWKVIMPVTDTTNVTKLFDHILDKPPLWDVKYVKRAVEIIEKRKDNNTVKHLEYVKSLKHK